MMNTRIGDELTCLVCSDRAMGNNFGAISCESCKAFFRRNAHDIEKLRCEFTGKCSITTLTRRHCRRCRLEKCFQVGMRKDWILTEEQLQIRRARIQSRKSRELATRSNSIISSSSSSFMSTSCSSSSSSLASSLPNHHHVTSSCKNTEQLSSIVSSSTSSSSTDQHIHHARHHHQQHHHSINHHSSPFISPMSFCLGSGLSSLSTACDGPEEEDEDEDEESDNDYAELCDKMGRKFFDNSFSHNMLTTLLDDNSLGHDHHQPIQSLYSSSSSSSIDPSHHFYSDFDQTSSSSMVSNVPNFLSTGPHIQSGHHLHNHHNNNSNHHLSTSFDQPNSSSIPTSPQLPCPPLHPFSSSSSSSSSTSSHHLPDHLISPFPYDVQSSSSSSSLSNSFLPNFPTKPEPGDFNHSIENEIARSKIYDLIMGSDLSLPINLSNEYITSNYALNQLLNQRMDELIHSCSTPYQPLLPTTNCEIISLQETVIQLIDYIAKSLIASIKSLTPFSRLPLQVRNDLFKGSFANLITIRLCFLFDLDKGGWPAPGSSKLIKYSFLELDSQSASYFVGFIKGLNERWHRDIKIGLILEAITLFSLNNVDMKHQEDISKEKYLYTYLLRRYLESIGLSVGQARSDCYELLIKLETIKSNVKPLEKIRQICSYQPLKAGQLLSEILDLA